MTVLAALRDVVGLWLVRLGARVMTDRAVARLRDATGEGRPRPLPE
jgi:hypothetical protein